MAKDDYDVIVFKILTYLYACLKRKISFDSGTFQAVLQKRDISEEYFTDILRMMEAEGLVKGVVVQWAWGSNYLLASDLGDLKITAQGIRYLKDNSKMKEITEKVLQSAGLVADLVKMVLPF